MNGEISNANREVNTFGTIGNYGDPGRIGGGTYTMPAGDNRKDPTIQDYENIFGPAARDIKTDLQRNKRHSRWHLPDALKGANPYLTDRVDGLITDTTASPFTTVILPYKYIENVDAKIKWNVWSFDEGMASRVPYESAARTLTQTKRSYAGYTIRHGLAITMEHNFMMSDKGRENFKNQLQQMVGCIQYTNDLDVHIALITAQSYAKERAEKYYMSGKTNHQIIREYIDLFGFMSKNINAMDIMIEDAKATLRTWGAAEPNFLLCNSKLTFQMTMNPEKTQYLTQGPDGVRRLKNGPDINTYRGLRIVHSRSFSMEDGAPPRDVLRRRVRVAEYYRIPYEEKIEEKSFAFYDESKDAWQKYSWHDLFSMAYIGELDDEKYENRNGRIEFGDDDYEDDDIYSGGGNAYLEKRFKSIPTKLAGSSKETYVDFKLDKRAWKTMTHPDHDDPTLAVDEDPVIRLLDACTKHQECTMPKSRKIPDDEIIKMMRVCGLKEHNNVKKQLSQHETQLGITGTADSEEYLQSYYAYRKNFCSYVKSWLIGNLVPKEVHAFMEIFNWQGFKDDGSETLRVDAERKAILDRLLQAVFVGADTRGIELIKKDKWELVIVRPNIEHNMLGIVMGRGGLDELGATFWGQTELSCFDDSMHGIWGMSYKYNEKAIVINNKNLIRLWDVAYDGYNGGKDTSWVNWMSPESQERFKEDTYELSKPYEGVSMMVMAFKNVNGNEPWPSPILFHDPGYSKQQSTIPLDAENAFYIKQEPCRIFNRNAYSDRYKEYFNMMPDFSKLHNTKAAGNASEENESQISALAFQGTMKIFEPDGRCINEVTGSGHHGKDYVGVASVRAGKGMAIGSMMDSTVAKII